jgi:hypothetical protein
MEIFGGNSQWEEFSMSASIETFLASYNPAVRALAQELRNLIVSVEPHVVERVSGSNAIRYGISTKAVDQVCSIAPAADALSLAFDFGTDLPDTQGLLSGTGKHSRQIDISVGEKPNLPYYRYLLEIAFAQAHGRHETRPVQRNE